MTDPTPDGEQDRSASSALFDLRQLIAVLFAIYGVVLTAVSPTTDNTKSDGIDINLWMGLGMLAVAAAFFAWARLRPLRSEGPSALARAEAARREGESGGEG